MPAKLIKLRNGAFISDVVDPYRQHVMKFYTADDMYTVQNEHKKLLVAYSREPGVTAFDTHNESTLFKVAWDSVKGRFKTLRQLCGGLATAFSNATSVDSDFSLMKWEKDEHRTSLTSLAFAGIMHAKQFEVLNSLNLRVLNASI
jgi:hypothetical protein